MAGRLGDSITGRSAGASSKTCRASALDDGGAAGNGHGILQLAGYWRRPPHAIRASPEDVWHAPDVLLAGCDSGRPGHTPTEGHRGCFPVATRCARRTAGGE